jgi:hypothetical protein
MRLQWTVVALAVCGLIAPSAFAQRGGGQASGGHASSGHASSGHASAGHADGRGGQSPGAHHGGHIGPHAPGVHATHGVPPSRSNPAGFNLPLPNPIVFGSAALPMPAPGGDIFRARPNTYGRSFRFRSGIGTALGGGPFFYGDADVAPAEAGDEASAATAPAASARLMAPATIVAAGPPMSADPNDVDDLHRHGEIRFDVQPREAQVFVDGTLKGTIGDFYHSLVGLSLPAGSHHVELRAQGYETVRADVKVVAGKTVGYRVMLKSEKAKGKSTFAVSLLPFHFCLFTFPHSSNSVRGHCARVAAAS